ncbi:MAG: hypothetical protein H6742_11015 [Alphaproteobacteria bacterium]|nr:hypothetical protein [Alphaproteobacteria bacterium]
MSEVRAASRAPAWPTLLGIQLVVIATLSGAWWRTSQGPSVAARTPLEEGLMTLPVAELSPAVSDSLERTRRSARALAAGEEPAVERFLGLSAGAADLVLAGVEWREPVAVPDAPDVLAVDCELRVVGDAYALPVFIDLLFRQSALPQLRAVVAGVRPGGAMDARLVLRFHRPAAVAGDPASDRVERLVPAADPGVGPLMDDARELSRWRRQAAHRPALEDASRALRDRAARQLPGALVSLWDRGGTVRWSAVDGLSVDAR